MSTRINIDRHVLDALLQGKVVCVGNIELHPKDIGDRLEVSIKTSSTKHK